LGITTTTPSSPTSVVQWLAHIFESSRDFKDLDDTEKAIRLFVQECFSSRFDGRKFFSDQKFWWHIVGKDDSNKSENSLSLPTIRYRLQLFHKYTQQVRDKRLFCLSDAAIWIDSDLETRERIILEISSMFPDFLQKHINSYSKSCAYFDDIALCHHTSGKAFKNRTFSLNKEHYGSFPPKVVGTNLISKCQNNKLLGTVMAIHNPVSPDFMKRYMDASDRSMFMAGDGKDANSGKALRFASQYHNYDSMPNFLQFGEGNGLRLLLSQSTQIMENSLLRIVDSK
jgi:hypothetical protein